MTADLVVDATGRGSRICAWLAMLGYPRPPVEQVQIGSGTPAGPTGSSPECSTASLGILTAADTRSPRAAEPSRRWRTKRFLVTLYGILS